MLSCAAVTLARALELKHKPGVVYALAIETAKLFAQAGKSLSPYGVCVWVCKCARACVCVCASARVCYVIVDIKFFVACTYFIVFSYYRGCSQDS